MADRPEYELGEPATIEVGDDHAPSIDELLRYRLIVVTLPALQALKLPPPGPKCR